MLNGKKIYMHIIENKSHLKTDHSNDYYTQIQMAMGLSGAKFCDFVIFSFKGLIISRIAFDEDYFAKLVVKLNMFHKDYMLPKLC